MKINLKPRIFSYKFWVAMIPAVTLLVQTIGAVFGKQWVFDALNTQLGAVLTAIFGILTLLGVVIDPTTAGVSDSEQAQDYGALITTKSAQIAQLQLQVESLKAAQTVTNAQITSGTLDADKLNITHLDATDIASGTITPDEPKEEK